VNVKELRTSLRLTQVEFAALLGVRQATISDWERGAKKPTRSMLLRLSEVRGFRAEDEIYPEKTNLDRTLGRVTKVTTFRGTALKIAHIEKGGVVLTRGLKLLKVK